jgi:hypothetical protein
VTPPAHQVMAKVSVKPEQVDFHVNKKASLIWQQGEVIAADGGHVNPNSGGDIIADFAMMAFDAVQVANDPLRFKYAYGKPQQVVVMTSLRENLERAKVFTDLNMVADESEVGTGRVKIIVAFIKTRVGCELDSFPIYLTVKLTIKDGKRIFVRKFFVYSTEQHSFKEQQANVSQQLMDGMVKAIKEWSNN